jgi:hypothetical protein
MNSIEAYIQFEKGLITDDGEVTNESTAKFLGSFMQEFHGFIGRVLHGLAETVRRVGGPDGHTPWSRRRALAHAEPVSVLWPHLRPRRP